MITHIVLFKLKDPGDSKKAREALLSMQGNIPQIRHLEVGIDLMRSQRSYDLSLLTKFDSLSALQEYQVHPFHVKVAEYLAAIRESVVTVDYDS